MKIGFTGTHFGMTQAQIELVKIKLGYIRCWDKMPNEFHHGDCIGADDQAAFIASDLNYIIYAHPPINNYRRAFHKSPVILEPKEYIVRDHDIVNVSEIMLATPHESYEMKRGGTWATIRYAKEAEKELHVIYPNGVIQIFNAKERGGIQC